MSDRYYMQMAEHFNMKPYELIVAMRDPESLEGKSLAKKAQTDMTKVDGKKLTRLDYNKQLTELLGVDIQGSKLPLPVLLAMVSFCKKTKKTKVTIPGGRLKNPYIEEVQRVLGDTLDLSAATVKTMSLFLGAINE